MTRTVVLAATLTLLLAPPGSAADGRAQEDANARQSKAALLLNFARFVEWPSGAAPAGAPFNLCVIDDRLLIAALERAAGRRLLNGRRVSVSEAAPGGPFTGCQLVFVSRQQEAHLVNILAMLTGVGVLSVGEIPGFAHKGGVINLATADDRVRFEINVLAAERARLRVSSKLLSLAAIVGAVPTAGRP